LLTLLTLLNLLTLQGLKKDADIKAAFKRFIGFPW